MREVPPEVLSSIFTLVVENNFFGRINPRYSRPVGASFLTKICSRWRAVALDTPEIWARICIQHHLWFPLDDQMTQVEQERLKSCMVLAKSFPLSVEIGLKGTNDAMVFEDSYQTMGFITLLRELVKNSNWDRLIVRMGGIPPDLCEAAIEMIQDRNLQSLRGLVIRFDGDMAVSLPTWQGATTFPNLRVLHIQHLSNGHFRFFRSIDTIFPCSQLTHVHLDLFKLEETLEILRLCCRSVRSIQIKDSSYLPNACSPPPISLPFLDSLTIISYTEYHIEFINTFTAPSLKSLSLSFICPYSASNRDLPVSFLERSRISTTLQKLHLFICGNVDPSLLMNILEATTGVEELFMSVSDYDQFHDYGIDHSKVRTIDFLQALARDDDRFLPKLKHLHIHHIEVAWVVALRKKGRDSEHSERPDCEYEWAKEFEAMIELRSARELRSVVLESASTDDKLDMGLDLERLRRLEEASGQRGLAIRVLKTRDGEFHHVVLGYGVGAQLSLPQHFLRVYLLENDFRQLDA